MAVSSKILEELAEAQYREELDQMLKDKGRAAAEELLEKMDRRELERAVSEREYKKSLMAKHPEYGTDFEEKWKREYEGKFPVYSEIKKDPRLQIKQVMVLTSKSGRPIYRIHPGNSYPDVYQKVPVLKKRPFSNTDVPFEDFEEAEEMKSIVYRYQHTLDIFEMELKIHIYVAEEVSEKDIKELEDLKESIWDF